MTVDKNTVVYARYRDNTNRYGIRKEIVINNIDKTPPVYTISPNGSEYLILSGNDSVQVAFSIATRDDQSGVSKREYVWSKDNKNAPTTGWNTFEDNKEIKVNITGGDNYLWVRVTDSVGNVTVGASNNYKAKYQITYDANGGNEAPPGAQEKEHDKDLILSSNVLTKQGFVFSGWSKQKNGTKDYDPGATFKENKALTLYAVWTKNSYTVTYNYSENGGTSVTKETDTKKNGEKIDLTVTAEKEGYKFKSKNTKYRKIFSPKKIKNENKENAGE